MWEPICEEKDTKIEGGHQDDSSLNVNDETFAIIAIISRNLLPDYCC